MTNHSEAFTPVFLGSGRCFHTMDWFRSCQQLAGAPPIFVTDNFGGEGFVPLLRSEDKVLELVLIDPVLFKRPTRVGHAWRNIVKMALVPLQVLRLRRVLCGIEKPFVFAHATYYAFLASFCNVRYSATPQGSEVLVRPFASKLYRILLLRSVRHSTFTTVDSNSMATRLYELSGVQPYVIQNGIDVTGIVARRHRAGMNRYRVTSIRGFEANYRIVDILQARDRQVPGQVVDFCFPFVEGGYEKEVLSLVRATDMLHGRLPRSNMYTLLNESICVISIPRSDSSPRSVYEAIFCGAAVLCTHSPYVDVLPACMRSRVVIINLNNPHWLVAGLEDARRIAAEPYIPSDEALDLFDQVCSMKKCLSLANNKAS